jgi:hypothetical protein
MHLVERALQHYAEEEHPELVQVRTSLRYPELRVVKYKNKVFYKDLWSPELCKMRGLVVDEDWRVRVRPFDKIFNRGERFAPRFDYAEEVHAVRKVNGFFAALTKDEDYGLIVSTTGSLDSPFVQLAEKHLTPLKHHGLINGVTYMFEIVDESDPHIVAEEPGAYLIGARTVCSKIQLHECDLDIIARGFGVKRPEWKTMNFGELVEEDRKHVEHEGWVVYSFDYERALKVKSAYYLTKKFFMRAGDMKLTAKWLNANRDNFDEEYYSMIDAIREDVQFASLTQEQRREWIERFLTNK